MGLRWQAGHGWIAVVVLEQPAVPPCFEISHPPSPNPKHSSEQTTELASKVIQIRAGLINDKLTGSRFKYKCP